MPFMASAAGQGYLKIVRRLLVTTLAALTLATACTPIAGDPKPEKSSTSGEPSSARPREISFDNKQPCALLTAEQLAKLKIDREGWPETSDFYQATGCSWTMTGASNRLILVTTEGIEAWTGGKRTGQPTKIDPILGFPAITVTLPSDPDICDVMVDTADGQYLVATFSVSQSSKDSFPKPCDGARQLAEEVMQNLVK